MFGVCDGCVRFVPKSTLVLLVCMMFLFAGSYYYSSSSGFGFSSWFFPGTEYYHDTEMSHCSFGYVSPETKISKVRKLSVDFERTGLSGGHHYIEISHPCKGNEDETIRTKLELNYKGKKISRKHYIGPKVLSEFYPSKLTLANVEKLFYSLDGNYTFIYWNCQHFAEELYKELTELDKFHKDL